MFKVFATLIFNSPAGLSSMSSKVFFASCLFLLVGALQVAQGDLVQGVISDFQDGTVQGWDGGTVTNILDSGPLGGGDHSLQLANGGGAGRFAMFNTGVNGVISPAVSAITSDILRPTGEGPAEIRLVLFDFSGTRWTSTIAATISDNGLWNNYAFSVLESDLTRVFGSGSYADLVGNLERIMFRYDPGPPNAGGTPLNGTMNFDNISAVPEPSSMLVLVSVLAVGYSSRRRR